MRPILRWLGSKSRMLKRILPLIPKGRWIVTVNDSALTRDLFSDCALTEVSSQNRLCNNRTHSQVRFGELIITPQ